MALHYEDSTVVIHSFVVGPWDNNVSVVRCRETGEALVVDAANEHEMLLDTCRALGVRSIVETHGRADHFQALPALREAGHELAVAPEDAAMLPSYNQVIGDDEVLRVGRARPGPTSATSR